MKRLASQTKMLTKSSFHHTPELMMNGSPFLIEGGENQNCQLVRAFVDARAHAHLFISGLRPSERPKEPFQTLSASERDAVEREKREGCKFGQNVIAHAFFVVLGSDVLQSICAELIYHLSTKRLEYHLCPKKTISHAVEAMTHFL